MHTRVYLFVDNIYSLSGIIPAVPSWLSGRVFDSIWWTRVRALDPLFFFSWEMSKTLQIPSLPVVKPREYINL